MTNVLCRETKKGPEANDGSFVTEIKLDLGKIRYHCPETKKKKGQIKKISPEDRFMIEGVQPATSSSLVKVDYFLTISLGYDGCTCCSNLPDACAPMTIIPLVNPACCGYQPPGGWQPMDLGFFNIPLTFNVKSKKH